MGVYTQVDAQHQAAIDDGMAYQDALTQFCDAFNEYGCHWIAGELVTWDSFSEWFHNDCDLYATWVKAMSNCKTDSDKERIAKTYKAVWAAAKSEWLELMFDEYCEEGS